MLKIWGHLGSINVRKVVWCAQELGLEFQRTDAGGRFGQLKTPECLERNPNALIPLIEVDDNQQSIVLWESNVIVRYLCAKHALGSLYPEPLAARFDAERWMDWQQTTLNRVSAGAFIQWIRTSPSERKTEVIAASVQGTEPLFALLDSHLANRPFVSGDTFTIADIPLGCEVHRWFGLPATHYQRPAWPNVERWFFTLVNRAGARGVLDLPLE
jgi:glutathione S-transferase